MLAGKCLTARSLSSVGRHRSSKQGRFERIEPIAFSKLGQPSIGTCGRQTTGFSAQVTLANADTVIGDDN